MAEKPGPTMLCAGDQSLLSLACAIRLDRVTFGWPLRFYGFERATRSFLTSPDSFSRNNSLISSSGAEPLSSAFDGAALPFALAHQVGHIHLYLFSEVDEGAGVPVAGGADQLCGSFHLHDDRIWDESSSSGEAKISAVAPFGYRSISLCAVCDARRQKRTPLTSSYFHTQ